MAALTSMPGVTVPEPEGAFYLFPAVRRPRTIRSTFCKRLLLETKVGLAPGVAFGAGGEGSVACAMRRIRQHPRLLNPLWPCLGLVCLENPSTGA